jgi:uncharacterized protein YndB with AHSA1/START domain
MASGARVVSDRRYTFPVDPEQFWALIADVDSYREWWPWLRSFEATGLDPGERWQCTVQPPLPYRVRFTVTLDEIIASNSISTTITGDIVGVARLDIAPRDDGCEIRLRSSLGPESRVLRVVAATARPLVTFGHNWVLDTGAQQFGDRAGRPGA